MRDLAPGQWLRTRWPVVLLRCARCGEGSVSMSPQLDQQAEPPRRCSRCGSPGWQVARGVLRRGRPPRKKPA